MPKIKQPTTLLFKRESDLSILPHRSSEESAGLDIFSTQHCILRPHDRMLIKTGFSVEIPNGYYGSIESRSGLALNNGVFAFRGIIDRDYRGEVGVLLVNAGFDKYEVSVGDKIAQLVIQPVPKLEPQWATTLSETVRGQKGFGSTGK